MSNPDSAPINTSFDDEEVAFDQSSVQRTPGAPAHGVNNSAPSAEPDFKFVERPKPVGIRDAYCREIKPITTRDGKALMVVSIQIADPDFPVSEANKPIDLMFGNEDTDLAQKIAAVLGLSYNSASDNDFTSAVGRAKGSNVHCRVFVSSWQGKVQVARFAPGYAKRNANDDAFWQQVDGLGITAESYKELTKNYCGIVAPR
jgi:hypothetical protein